MTERITSGQWEEYSDLAETCCGGWQELALWFGDRDLLQASCFESKTDNFIRRVLEWRRALLSRGSSAFLSDSFLNDYRPHNPQLFQQISDYLSDVSKTECYKEVGLIYKTLPKSRYKIRKAAYLSKN